MKLAKDIRGLCIFCVMAGLTGCIRMSTPNAEGPTGVFVNAGEHGVTEREYRVDPPDSIVITAPNIKELDHQTEVIRPNGTITLELLDEDVFVAGMTLKEIEAVLTQVASKYYVKPDLRVRVVANSKFYYVFGFGSSGQGKKPYTGRVTVVSALADAGFSQTAWPEQVRLSRPGLKGAPNATVVINFNKIKSYGDLTQNYLIEEGDIIDVPLTPLSQLSFDLTQILAPISGSAALVSSPVSAAQTFRTP
jgi:protein involved in polysaccharide export with SLBB domain